MIGWLAALVLALAAAAGCGGAETTEEQTAAAGEELYAASCAACHGPQGEGTGQGPPLVHIVYEPSHHADEAFHRAVQQGVVPHHFDFGPMPPVPDLEQNEVDAIIGYVRGLQRAAGID